MPKEEVEVQQKGGGRTFRTKFGSQKLQNPAQSDGLTPKYREKRDEEIRHSPLLMQGEVYRAPSEHAMAQRGFNSRVTEVTSFPPTPTQSSSHRKEAFFCLFLLWKTVSEDTGLAITEQNGIKIPVSETASALVFSSRPPELFQ